MNKKSLLTIAPSMLLFGALVGCGGDKSLSSIKVETTINPSNYYVGQEFSKSDLKVTANYANGTSQILKDNEYTVSPSLPYTFTNDDVSTGKEFTVTYFGKTSKVAVNVAVPTDEQKFLYTFKKASDIFQNSTLIYDKSDIKYTIDDEEQVLTASSHEIVEGTRVATITRQGESNPIEIAGGEDYTYYEDSSKGIKYLISMIKAAGGSITYTSDLDTGECGLSYTTTVGSFSHKFNKNGYLIEEVQHVSGTSKVTCKFTYSGEPHAPAI